MPILSTSRQEIPCSTVSVNGRQGEGVKGTRSSGNAEAWQGHCRERERETRPDVVRQRIGNHSAALGRSDTRAEEPCVGLHTRSLRSLGGVDPLRHARAHRLSRRSHRPILSCVLLRCCCKNEEETSPPIPWVEYLVRFGVCGSCPTTRTANNTRTGKAFAEREDLPTNSMSSTTCTLHSTQSKDDYKAHSEAYSYLYGVSEEMAFLPIPTNLMSSMTSTLQSA